MSVTCLFSGVIWRLSGLRVVDGPVKRHVLFSSTFLIIHLITAVYLDSMKLNGATGFTRHEDFARDDLACNEQLIED